MAGDALRIDKWLWAARFYKTRSLAKQAVENGRVQRNGQRVKPAQVLAVGDTLEVRRGDDLRTLLVQALSAQRGPASQAQQLYLETEESIRLREAAAEVRRMQRSEREFNRRPDKRDRRSIRGFKRG